MIRNRKYLRAIALFFTTNIILEVVVPNMAYALTSGPAQPEFSSFEPVATTNMVNEFSGDFTYNLPVIEVPGPHGSSYSLSLSYHSGSSPEEEASWVGYGWTLNPGAINRSTRGFPDDYNGAKVKYHNKVPDHWTATVGAKVSAEAISFDLPFQASAALRYNNYRGFGYNAGVGLSLGKGVVNLGYNVSNGQGSFSLSLSPLNALSALKAKSKDAEKNPSELSSQIKMDKEAQRSAQKKAELGARSLGVAGAALSSYIQHSFSSMERATAVSDYVSTSINASIGVNLTPTFLELGSSGDLFGSIALQAYKDEKNLNAFGYLYSTNSGEKDMMDYYVEKETPYQKRDVFLGIPFNNADYFSVSGEGLGGGFRLYQQEVGHFKPNNTVSETAIVNAGGEIEAGFNWGGGSDIGVGVSAITSRGWEKKNTGFSSIEKDPNSIFFRFNNDLGGSWLHASQDDLLSASISGGGAPGVKGFKARLPGNSGIMNFDKPVGRSSFIGYSTNKTISIATSRNRPYEIYSHRKDLRDISGQARSLDDGDNADGIGEIAVFNESGNRYVYGLPVYARSEKNLQFGLQNAPASSIDANFLAYYKDDKTKIGEERETGYATAYLLSEITTPDYVDKTFNGPSLDDLGGYTRFNYERHAGGSNLNTWFKWRMPYTGLSYSRNSMSDPKDDLGSYSEGLKEIYYLQSIETKTHAAIFVTSDREDGLEAGNDAITNRNAKGTKVLKKLDRIEIYSLQDVQEINDNLFPKPGARPIKTVNLEYDYHLMNGEHDPHLMNGVPNASSGKLTLKKLWFEYEGITEARISPYRFDYLYNNAVYPTKYATIRAEMDQLADASQNPGYSKFNLDAWGNYQENGDTRYAEMRKWVDQKGSTTFDPAAWQLKTITLPSGGQIHVQYEQDDYSYVQDQVAHVMVRLDNATNHTNNIFYLDTGSDLDLSASKLDLMKKMIHDRYIRDKNKLYFKFLYKLMNNGTPDLSSCNSEYITGYVDVETVDIDAGNGKLYVRLYNDESRLPRQVCKDFVMTQRIGNLSTSGNCNASSAGIDPKNDAVAIIKQLGNMAKTIVAPSSLCRDINAGLSYLRVPLPVSKKGGGLRVKRLLTYDQGLENNPVVYGNEYLYEFEDPLTGTVRSSGVATNEPSPIREENILVDFIAREKESLASKIISGRDKKQSEGPLGESIMPAASVGYSQVVVKNIHSGKTNVGFNVKQFYTAYDYPFEVEQTGMQDKKDFVPFPFGLVNVFVNNVWLTQGFTFKLNNMHGQFRRDANYSGTYTPGFELATVVTEQQYRYFEPGKDKIPVTTDLLEGIHYEDPGKEIDITFADKAIIEEQYDASVEFDVSVGIIPFFPIPIIVPQASAVPSLTHTRSELYTHATSKVVRYPAIVKEVISRQDNILHRQVNLAFDAFTGKPVSVRSYDEFTGSYLSQNIPASWEYDNFRPMAMEQGKIIEASMGYSGDSKEERLYFTGGEACQLLAEFTKGDLLELSDGVFYHVKDFDFFADEVIIVPSSTSTGSPPTSLSSVRVVNSGNNNRLTDQAGRTNFHSTNGDVAPPDASDAARWVSNAFTNDLNNAMATQTEFILAGPYANMNMTGYLSALPEGCDVNLRDVTIRNASFIYFNREGSLDLYLLSFDLNCGGNNWIIIDAAAL
ncbi:hypothetical protein FNH22_17325 [Fulvivirga sp. M361]|uniref:hypothetical protein n=1 Tax=Fulvivirga sp. M361 TaxID=2594266 RepID=UPI00117BC68B|nr:hypothetical protein [Fulvivirga sp. M361]TRX56139.1 hypothetical protein FNH22_17325 [Fulvivirga sp. M361]